MDNVVDFKGAQTFRQMKDRALCNFLWFFDFVLHDGTMTAEEISKDPLYLSVFKETKRRAALGNERCRKLLTGDYSWPAAEKDTGHESKDKGRTL